VNSAAPTAPEPGFRVYGSEIGHYRGNERIVLWRKGQRCIWAEPGGKVVSRQRNVAPALAWASANGYVCGW